MGYVQGLDYGKESTIQKGFEMGFKIGFDNGIKLGEQYGEAWYILHLIYNIEI